MIDEEWKNSEKQRKALLAKYDGHCAYCGCVLGKGWHADHLKPCIRITTDQWGRPLPAALHRFIKPERNCVSNMMPACQPCNNSKHSYSLEGWRDVLQRSAQIARRATSTFKAGERFGIITVTEKPIVFYFETLA